MKKDSAHLRNIIALALADNTLREREEEFIRALGRKMGFNEGEIASILRSGPSLTVEPPARQADRVRYLKDFIGLIMSDGEIDQAEEGLCRTFAVSLGFEAEIVSSYIDKTREFLRDGYTRNRIGGEIDNLMQGRKEV